MRTLRTPPGLWRHSKRAPSYTARDSRTTRTRERHQIDKPSALDPALCGRARGRFEVVPQCCGVTVQRNTVARAMGLATFLNRSKTPLYASVVTAEFPLLPEVVFTCPDGSVGTMARETFVKQFEQRLPELPVCHLNDDDDEDEEPTREYDAPSLALLPPSYELLYKTMRRIEEKIDLLLARE